MTASNPPLILEHPDLGRLPARRLLDCIFALAPDQSLLHLHIEQVRCSADGRVLAFTDALPEESRKRCRVIPPFVVAFREPAEASHD